MVEEMGEGGVKTGLNVYPKGSTYGCVKQPAAAHPFSLSTFDSLG